jgi:hypothetical protein
MALYIELRIHSDVFAMLFGENPEERLAASRGIR